ncbi:MAG: cation diffusion facilitator family transporter [Myxococcota bacterium]|jgi:cation diffusion facilitator family transporter
MGSQPSPDDPARTRSRIAAGLLSLVVAIGMVATKFFAFDLTGSSAIFSDALESTTNILASGMLLYSLALSLRPVDRNHPYGHGKVEFFSAGFEGALIFGASLVIVVRAVREIQRGPELQDVDLALVLLVALALINGALGTFLVRRGRQTNSMALVADGRHVMTDVWTTGGVIAGLVAVRLTGWVILDPLVAIAVGLHILRTGWRLLREAVAGLMDEADDPLLERVANSLQTAREPGWIDAHRLRLWRAGAVLHVDLHLLVPRYWDAVRLHEVDDKITRAVFAGEDDFGDVIVHFDPCRPRDCTRCGVEECPVRQAPLEAVSPFALPQLTRWEVPDEAAEPAAN